MKICLSEKYERETLYDTTNPMPILDKAVYTRDLSRRLLEKILNVRENQMALTQFDLMQDLINHSNDIVSNSLYLTLDCVGVSTSKR